MAQDDYIKLQLRVPRELHARTQASAETTGKSLNAELIARLEFSFEAQTLISELRSVVVNLIDSSEHQKAALASQWRLLRMTGRVMALTLTLNPKKAEDSALIDLMQQFAEAVAHGDIPGAVEPIVKLIEAGKAEGIIGADGELRPEFSRLRAMFLEEPAPKNNADDFPRKSDSGNT